jgi:hypothetical protein
MTRAAELGFGSANILVAALVAWGVGFALPARWWVVDAGSVVLTALMAASGLALLLRHRHAASLTRLAAAVALLLGLAVFAALALTASWLAGVYGPVGKGGATLFALVALLVLPYVVVLPAVELLWIGPRRRGPGP